jgi:hypothetical protein
VIEDNKRNRIVLSELNMHTKMAKIKNEVVRYLPRRPHLAHYKYGRHVDEHRATSRGDFNLGK